MLFFHSEIASCKIPSLALAKARYVSTPTFSPGLQKPSVYVLVKVCSVSIFLMPQSKKAPFALRKGFYCLFSLRTASGCVQCRAPGGVHLPKSRIYPVIKIVGRPWGGFIPSTGKHSKYGHCSENYGSEEPGKENCCKLHFLGSCEAAMCLVPN